MEQDQDNDPGPRALTITTPVNNGYVRNAEIPVTGTTTVELAIVIRVFKGEQQVAQKTATLQGSQWSALIGGAFEPGQYRFEATQSGPVNVTANLRVTPVTITAPPSGDVPNRQFTVSGSGGEQGVGTVSVHNASNNALLSTATINNTNGNWTATVTLPSETQTLTFYAKQKIGTYDSSPSASVTVGLLVPPVSITSPSSGNVSTNPFAVTGRGGIFNVGVVTVHNNANDAQLSPAIINQNGDWSATVSLPSETTSLTFYAKQKFGNRESVKSNLVTVTLFAAPVITAPQDGSLQDTSFILTGNKGRIGAKIHVFTDTAGEQVGQSEALTGASWSCSVTVSAGMRSLIALQKFNGSDSERSAPRSFSVRPPALTSVTITNPTETSTQFAGTGYNSATVQISIVSGPEGATPPSTVEVANGSWRITATNWPFGTYHLKAIQKVRDNANGWIESQPYTFTHNRVLPDVTDVAYTPEYQPTISGKGFTGASVRLANPGGASDVAQPVTVVGGVWSRRVTEVWGPTFEREVHIKQSLNGQLSPNWYRLKITISPLAPVMNPPVENGLSPNLSGTCWPGAVLKLSYSDSATEHTPVNNNGSWTFRRETPFEPGITHTATLIQHAASQASPPASRTFVVSVPMLQPVITHPNPGEVGRDVTIRGQNGMADATMQLRDAQFDSLLGQPKVLISDGEWFIDLAGLEFREYTLDARQTLDGRPSERSAHLVLTVVLLPPEFDVPQPDGKLPRTAELSGKGMPNGRVSVWLQGQDEPLLANIPVDFDGNWKAEVTLPVGQTTIRAKQFFTDEKGSDQESEYGPWLTYDVVPAAPFIETPATREHIGRRVVVSGFGVPGDTVTVRLDDSKLKVLGRSPVLDDRTWSVTVTLDQPGGTHGLVAVAEYDGFESDDSQPRAVVLGTYLPSIEVPTAGRWFDNPVGFEGRGRPGVGQVVSWYNPDRALVADLAVDAGAWHGEAVLPLPSGGHWCRFKQTLTDSAGDGTVSDWVESGRFEVLPPFSQP